MTEEFSFPTRKLNFTGSLKFDRSLSIKTRKQFEINMADKLDACMSEFQPSPPLDKSRERDLARGGGG